MYSFTSILSLCFLIVLANAFLPTQPNYVEICPSKRNPSPRTAGVFHPALGSTQPTESLAGFSMDESEQDDHSEDERSPHDQEQQDIYDEIYQLNLQIAKYAKASSVYNKTAAWTAYEILRNEQRYPDTVAYNSVLKAFARTSSFHNKQAAQMAQDLLEEMRQINSIQVKENQEWYRRMDLTENDNVTDSHNQIEDGDSTLEPLTREELSIGPPLIRVKPNVRSVSTVMDAWGKQGNPAAAQKAEDLLFELEDVYEETGDMAMQPNAISYNTVITAWAKSGAKHEGAKKAQALLDIMIRYSFADVISYNSVLHAWARSGLPDAGEHAEKILRSMDGVLPNARTYTTVMDAWSRSYGCPDSARRAMTLLAELEAKQSERPDDNRMQPNCVTYSTAIHALALSKTEPLKAHKAFGLLQRMNRLGKENPRVSPNRVTYNSVLNACATSCPTAVKSTLDEQGMASNLPTLPAMVRTIYQQLLTIDSRQQPDHFTFGTVLKAVANLFWGEPDQVAFGKEVFLEACRRGEVSFGVLSQLRQALPAAEYSQLIPPEAMSPERSEPLMHNIPKEWTRNVREDKRRRRWSDMDPPSFESNISAKNSTSTE